MLHRSPGFFHGGCPYLPRFAADWSRGWEQWALCASWGVHWSKAPHSGASTSQQRAMPICILHILKRVEDFFFSTVGGWWREDDCWDVTWPAPAEQSSQPRLRFPLSPWPGPWNEAQLSAKTAAPIPCPLVHLLKCVYAVFFVQLPVRHVGWLVIILARNAVRFYEVSFKILFIQPNSIKEERIT